MAGWEDRGASANINYYRSGDTWCSVLCNTIERVVKEKGSTVVETKRVPDYSITVYRDGVGEVDRFRYEPKRRPNPIALSPRTIARLVGERMAVAAE